MNVNLGYKYRLYPTSEQKKELDHHMFVSNQAYNICVNIWQEALKNEKKISSVEYDTIVKDALRKRKLPFKTVITQQARMQLQSAVKVAFRKDVASARKKAVLLSQSSKNRARALRYGFPVFKNSKDLNQSFTWNNQGCSFKEDTNSRFKLFRVMRMDIKFRYHREFPEDYKLCSVVISRDSIGCYYISFTIEFKKDVRAIKAKDLDIKRCAGIDLNTKNIAVSAYEKPIDNGVIEKKNLKLERKQSRRVLNKKTGSNYKKTQKKINRRVKRLINHKQDVHHKITNKLADEFDLIAVEDLRLQGQMTKSAKGTISKPGKNVRQKAGLNRVINKASFYLFRAKLQYKLKFNGKLFVKVCPRNTSIRCNMCGYIDKKNRKTQSKFKCLSCGHSANADMNASKNILNLGLASLGIGPIHQTINESLSSSGAVAYG